MLSPAIGFQVVAEFTCYGRHDDPRQLEIGHSDHHHYMVVEDDPYTFYQEVEIGDCDLDYMVVDEEDRDILSSHSPGTIPQSPNFLTEVSMPLNGKGSHCSGCLPIQAV